MNSDFPPLKNDLLLRAARGEQTDRAPVWVMRQAGRYLPEFRKVREDHEFFEICRTPELATEVTIQPIRRYKGLIDAAIIFSDILVIPQALGMEVLMQPGPVFPRPLDTPADLANLPDTIDVDKELGYVFDAIKMTREKLEGQVPLIGFCGAPWTLMMYMIEGGSSRTMQKSKTWLFKYPEESRALLKRLADVCVDFLVGQVKAGAQLLQVFDSAAGDLSPYDFETFSIPVLQQISIDVRNRLSKLGLAQVPLTLFAKGASPTLAARCGYDVIGLHWTQDPLDVVNNHVANTSLQGNLDPMVLFGGREAIEREVERMCKAFRSARGGITKGWIANLGHGITPGVDPDDLKWFFECMHKYSASA
ncbi:Uroporphyrinogen decarboxylase [Scleroderma yunnanense]